MMGGDKLIMSEKIVVRQTANYGMFELLGFNRDVRRTGKLEESMREYGWIPAYPMYVIPNGNTGRYIIKDGHHRLFVATKLGIPVRYVVCHDEADIRKINGGINLWDKKDYMSFYCRNGLQDYLEAKDYIDETGIPLGLALSMLMGHTAGSVNWRAKFNNGEYKINRDSNHARVMKEIILLCRDSEIGFYRNNLFIQAMSRVVRVKELDLKRLKTRLKLFAPTMKKQATMDQYLEMIQDVYNRKHTAKLPLKFLAAEAVKRRSAVSRDAQGDSRMI